MSELRWKTPKQTPDEIIDRYVALVQAVPGPIRVWARVAGSTLHLISLIDESDDSERALYAAERDLLGEVEPESVSFEVYRTAQPLIDSLPDCITEESPSELVLQST